MSQSGKNEELLSRAAKHVQRAKRLFIITGAGISADSGLPTYRGVGGLYEDMGTAEGYEIEELLSGAMLAQKPALCWKYLHEIENACRGAKPNRAHAIITEMEQHFEHVCVLTQNVDGFHRGAGSQNVIDIHGDVHDLRCTQCEHRERVVDYAALAGNVPHCPQCGAVVRPDVVLFGELLPMAKAARLQAELNKQPDVVLTVGTTSAFPYIAGPVIEANLAGTPTIEINPGPTEVSAVVDIKIELGAAAAFEAIWSRVK